MLLALIKFVLSVV